MPQVYTAGTLVPPNAQIQSITEGVIVAWEFNLTMIGKYLMRINSTTGSEPDLSLNLRGIDFGGETTGDNVCVVGCNTLVGGSSDNVLNGAFISCFDRSSTGSLTTKWTKFMSLNIFTGLSSQVGWEHIQMDETHIYVATRGTRLTISGNTQSDNQFDTPGPAYAAVAKIKISDGSIVWIKRFQFGTSGSFSNAKGITSLALRPDALYASISVLYIDAGYDYLKINPSDGSSIGVSGLSTSVTMPNTANLPGYSILTGYNLTTTYTAGSSNVTTVSVTLDETDLNSTVSNQWHIEPTYVKYPLNTFSSSVNSSSTAVCSATINQTYYFQGTGTGPAAGDNVFSNASGTVLSSGRYRTTSTEFLLVGSNGFVESVNNCSGNTLTPFLVGNPQSSSTNICSQSSSQATYYHDGSGTFPVVNDIVYLFNNTNNPVDGGTGMNWPYFPAGPVGPDGWFRITGSTGTVQSQTNCP
jgi:hypothetical protein